MHDLLTVLRGSHDRELSVYRPGVERIKFLPASFAGNRKQGSTLTSIVLDGAVASVNSGKAPIAVAEDRLVGVEKSFWIDDGRDAGIGIVPSIFPGEDAPVGNDTFRIRLIRPKMHHVAAVAEPLIEDAGGKVFIESEFEIYVRIQRSVWFPQQPPLPIRVLFPKLRGVAIEPLLPLHVDIHQPFLADAGVHRSESPSLFIHVPFLLDMDDVADSPGTNDVPHRERIRLAAVLCTHLDNLF